MLGQNPTVTVIPRLRLHLRSNTERIDRYDSGDEWGGGPPESRLPLCWSAVAASSSPNLRHPDHEARLCFLGRPKVGVSGLSAKRVESLQPGFFPILL